MKQLLNTVMIVVGLLLLAWGYAIWFTRHESTGPRAILSFIYVIPGWALTAMGYIGWRIDGWARLPATPEEQTRNK